MPDFKPLWIEGKKQFSLSQYTSISIPDLPYEAVKRFGVDTVILGSFAKNEVAGPPLTFIPLKFDKDLRIGIKVTFNIDLMVKTYALSPWNTKFREFILDEITRVFDALPKFHFLVYESLALTYDEMGLNEDDEHLSSEIAKEEIALIEEIIRGKASLIYIFPSKVHALKEIAIDTDPATWLVFSSREGNPFQDHLKINPFLTESCSEDLKGFQLASLINTGSILQGGGLWPTVTLDLIQTLYPLMQDLHIIPIPCIHAVPKAGSFLEASLTITSEKDLLIWLKKHHGEGEPLLKDLKEVRELCLHLSTMRALLLEKCRDTVSPEETRLLAASVFYRLKSLSLKKTKAKRFQDYLEFFLRDASRIVLHFTQSFNITLQESFEQDSGKKGFWTEFTQGQGSGLRSMGKVTLAKTPLLDPSCPNMKAVYEDAGF